MSWDHGVRSHITQLKRIVPGTQYLIYGCPELLRRLLNNSGGQHDLDEDTDAGDDYAGKNEQRADKPFDKPGFIAGDGVGPR